MDSKYVIRQGEDYLVNSTVGYSYLNKDNATLFDTHDEALKILRLSPICDNIKGQVVDYQLVKGTTINGNFMTINRVIVKEKPPVIVDNRTNQEKIEDLQKQVATLLATVQPHRGFWWT